MRPADGCAVLSFEGRAGDGDGPVGRFRLSAG